MIPLINLRKKMRNMMVRRVKKVKLLIKKFKV